MTAQDKPPLKPKMTEAEILERVEALARARAILAADCEPVTIMIGEGVDAKGLTLAQKAGRRVRRMLADDMARQAEDLEFLLSLARRHRDDGEAQG